MMYATHEGPNTNDHIYTLIEPDKLVSTQLDDDFCSEICRLLNGGCFPSQLTRTTYVFESQRWDRKSLYRILFKKLVQYTNHYSKLALYSGVESYITAYVVISIAQQWQSIVTPPLEIVRNTREIDSNFLTTPTIPRYSTIGVHQSISTYSES